MKLTFKNILNFKTRTNFKTKINLIIKDNKAQISLEFLLILGVVVLVALIVGFYLKQASANQAKKVNEYQYKSTQGNN